MDGLEGVVAASASNEANDSTSVRLYCIVLTISLSLSLNHPHYKRIVSIISVNRSINRSINQETLLESAVGVWP